LFREDGGSPETTNKEHAQLGDPSIKYKDLFDISTDDFVFLNFLTGNCCIFM